MRMMRSDSLENDTVAALAVLHPITNPGDGPTAEFGLFDDFGVLFASAKHLGSFEPSTYLDNLFLCHDITEKVLHRLPIANTNKNVC